MMLLRVLQKRTVSASGKGTCSLFPHWDSQVLSDLFQQITVVTKEELTGPLLANSSSYIFFIVIPKAEQCRGFS